METGNGKSKLEVKTKEDQKLNYVHVKSRSFGFTFQYDGYQYLYKYPENYIGKEGGDFEFLEKRKIESQNKNGIKIANEEFRIVEIIEIDEGYILCPLVILFGEETEFWLTNDTRFIANFLYKTVNDMRYQYKLFHFKPIGLGDEESDSE